MSTHFQSYFEILVTHSTWFVSPQVFIKIIRLETNVELIVRQICESGTSAGKIQPCSQDFFYRLSIKKWNEPWERNWACPISIKLSNFEICIISNVYKLVEGSLLYTRQKVEWNSCQFSRPTVWVTDVSNDIRILLDASQNENIWVIILQTRFI